ncbi:EamA family transporter [Glaciimonas immobilis]|uniref:O-acetylserine/cysteine efflux transporter n=1 Tax=Glaciimonas immobilis TaxID=728004 RepID=A0A840RY42_9BURK|nr:EamA family transporter [Glaciimonas immobilis]KAF3996755.1 EamA family transporter [Glaciimonas immobilis]MBB5201319.1 O-acetylserine/cysteine efflux transporter [Glaciimonas immobilis]
MQFTDILLALLTVTIWGFNFVVIRIGLHDLPPLLFSALRFLFAAIPLIFFIKRPAIPWHLLIAYGLFQFALQFALLFSGMKLGFTAGLASLVIQLQAFFTIGLAVLVLKEHPRAAQLIGAFIALAGMGLVAAHLDGAATLIGFLLVVSAGVSWAAANIVTKTIGKVNPLALVVWGSLVAVPPLLLASILTEGPAAWASAASHFSWRSAGTVAFQSYPNTIIGFGIWSVLMRKYPAATIAPFALLVPVVGMLSATLVLDEPLQWWKITAGLLVLCGLALNQFGARLILLLKPAR